MRASRSASVSAATRAPSASYASRARLRVERLPHFAERFLQRLLILGHGLPLARLHRLDFRGQSPALEDRLRERNRELPDAGGPREEIAQRRAFAAKKAGQRDPGKERSARLRDACVGRDQALLGGGHVGPAQQQVRRQSFGHDRRGRPAALRAPRDRVLGDGARAAAGE